MSEDEREGPERSPGLERALGVLGGLLTLSLLAFLGYQAVVPETTARLDAAVVRVEQTAAQHVVHVRVHNSGGRTAEQVVLHGTLTEGGRTLEEASVTLASVAPHSSRRAVLVFTADPAASRLDLRVSGYTLP